MSVDFIVRPVENLQASTRHRVTSDLPAVRYLAAFPGARAAQMNRNGATSVLTDDGEYLGVRPGEFDFVCPFAKGRTYLDRHPDGSGNGTWRIDCEPGQNIDGRTIAGVSLANIEGKGWCWIIAVAVDAADHTTTNARRDAGGAT